MGRARPLPPLRLPGQKGHDRLMTRPFAPLNGPMSIWSDSVDGREPKLSAVGPLLVALRLSWPQSARSGSVQVFGRRDDDRFQM
jgi:hypothetical protein